MTVMLTSIVIYLYTVIAFNFFRKFYVKDNDGTPDPKCNDMKTCFIFHLHTGLRAGGGIGDEIEAPDGDESESYRILFDLTFFFFVIIILLAIIQGNSLLDKFSLFTLNCLCYIQALFTFTDDRLTLMWISS
ncbi:unnamed protein product [Trichobilharzia regenti]|nr:unnamed protein product [Trichobilharzia regenti]